MQRGQSVVRHMANQGGNSGSDPGDPYARGAQMFPRLSEEMAERVAAYGIEELVPADMMVSERGRALARHLQPRQPGLCSGGRPLGQRQAGGVECRRRFGRGFGNPPVSQRAALADLRPKKFGPMDYSAFPASGPGASDDLNSSMKPRTRDGMWWRAGNTAQIARLTGSASCNATSTRSPRARSSTMSQ